VAGLASFGRRARRRGSAHRCGVRWLATPARRGWIGANLREGGASCWGGMRKEEQMKGSLDCPQWATGKRPRPRKYGTRAKKWL
jgi:hypothetical protein